MWSILLVEDEVFVRRKLKETMDWQGMGFAVVGEAGNGAEAIELIRRIRPDVVITDIVMPLMNGVELLKQARQEGFNCRFVMLTVMSDFPFVQQALEYGASSYMLKLYMDPATLAETMDKVAKELVQQHRLLARESDELYRTIWNELSRHSPAEPSVETSSALLAAIPGTSGCKLMVITVLHGRSELPLHEFLSWELVDSGSPPMWQTWGNEIISSFFCWVPEAEHAFLQRKRTVPCGVVYSEWTAREDLKEAWANALSKAETLWYHPATGLYPCLSARFAGAALPLTWAEEHDILHNLERLRWTAVQSALNNLWDTLEERRASLHHVTMTANRINRLGANLVKPGGPDYYPLLAPAHKQLGQVLLARLEDYYRQLITIQVAHTDHPEVNKIISYLHDRYEQEITLQELARLVCMDDKYVSGLFKKKTGTSIIQYLHQIRIGQAKRLLLETDCSIAEIGERVGFANDNYFIKIFKRSTGTTPASFRHQS